MAGSSHASAFTLATMLGGKPGWTPVPRSFLEAREPLLKEPLAPFADDLPRRVQALGNLIVIEALSCIKHDLGANNISIR
jgi:hypothetical protein